MNRPALVAIGVLLGGLLVALVPGGGVERKVLPIQGGIEIAECLPDGTRHGESLTYRGWLSSRQVFDHGIVVEAVQYSPTGEVLVHSVEGDGYQMEEVK